MGGRAEEPRERVSGNAFVAAGYFHSPAQPTGPASCADFTRAGFWFALAQPSVIVPRTMSQHRSLRGQGAIKAKRNVLKRFERVEVLKKRGQFKEGQSVIGLKKTKPDE
jgi:small basic protein (TIGR04137 family)